MRTLHHPSILIRSLLVPIIILLTVVATGIGRPDKKTSPGAKVFDEQGCGTCHGADFKGTQLGPPLSSVKQNWKKKELLAYLKNPSAYAAKVPRLKKLGEQYTMMKMPEFNTLKKKDAEALVNFLLTVR